MATTKKSALTVVLDPHHAAEATLPDAPDYPDDASAPLCPSCGELLAWHDEPCVAAANPEAGAKLPTTPTLSLTSFTYALGQTVQPAPDAPASPVIWRGQVRARHPRTGLIHRVNVYRLGNGYWDCYYETELQAA